MDTTGMGTGMWLIWVIGILIVIVLVKLTMDNGSDRSGSSSRTALEILEERFAKGEINSEEFESMKKELDNT